MLTVISTNLTKAAPFAASGPILWLLTTIGASDTVAFLLAALWVLVLFYMTRTGPFETLAPMAAPSAYLTLSILTCGWIVLKSVSAFLFDAAMINLLLSAGYFTLCLYRGRGMAA